jgi:peptidoglycan hydrolase-like protein with peptidoglycan-binding domain
MGDSSQPPGQRTNLPAYAFYLAGATPHVWSPAQVDALDARWGLPICVQVNPDADAAADAVVFAGRLLGLRWRKGTAVALDTEDKLMPAYIEAFDAHMRAHGWTLVHYESKSAEAGNPMTSGGKWIPDWDGVAALPPGAVAAQYASAAMTGGPWDQSVISSQVRLGEIHPVALPAGVDETLSGQLPVTGHGSSGWSVHMLQAMLARAFPEADVPAMRDGVFGPVTESWVKRWHELYGITADHDYAGAATVQSLLTRS